MRHNNQQEKTGHHVKMSGPERRAWSGLCPDGYMEQQCESHKYWGSTSPSTTMYTSSLPNVLSLTPSLMTSISMMHILSPSQQKWPCSYMPTKSPWNSLIVTLTSTADQSPVSWTTLTDNSQWHSLRYPSDCQVLLRSTTRTWWSNLILSTLPQKNSSLRLEILS